MIMRVAIDIDGVLSDQFSFFDIIAKEVGITQPYDHDYNGIFMVRDQRGRSLGDHVFKDRIDDFLTKCKPIAGSAEALDRFLSNEHMQCYIVTSRKPEHRQQTLTWLESYYDISNVVDIIHTQNKTEAPCQVLIDDHVKYVKQYIDQARMSVLVDQPYNQNFQAPIRVTDLNEAYQQLLPYL
jgi:5'(3')-deoxyribonucleotidase